MQKKMDEIVAQNPGKASEISPDDPVGVVLGKEHPGSVKAMGLGVVPTTAFKRSTTRLSGMKFNSSSSSTSSPQLQQNVESRLQAMLAYIAGKEGGTIPEELAGLFPGSTQQVKNVQHSSN